MNTGVSIYFSSGREFNEALIEKARKAKVKHGFTSMHIPEEDEKGYREDAKALFKSCREAGIALTIDVDPTTPERLGLKSMAELKELGVESLRLDFGFDDSDVVELSKLFHIVWNASTVSVNEVKRWETLGACIDNFSACHNYYPKKYSGLSLERVKEINSELKMLGMRTEGFVPGNKVLRGPIKEGLPTVEEHRELDDILLSFLQMYDAKTDIVYIGDCDIFDSDWAKLVDLSDGFVRLHTSYLNEERLKGIIQHDRPDSSEYVIRSQESRLWDFNTSVVPRNAVDAKVGDIRMANDLYLRYRGEVEICRKPIRSDERVNVIGHVEESDLVYIPYIKNGMGFMFV